MLDVTVKGLNKLKKDLKREGNRQEKAMQVAVRVEGYRLMRLMKKEIAKGFVSGP